MISNFPSIRGALKRDEIMRGLRQAGFNDTDSAIVFDMAVKSCDDAMDAFAETIKRMGEDHNTVQAVTMGLQFIEVAASIHCKTVVEMLAEVGAVVLREDANGKVHDPRKSH